MIGDVLGVGHVERLDIEAARVDRIELHAHEARGHRDTHNTYLNWFAETGAPGLALFLGLVIVTMTRAEKARRRFRLTRQRAASQLFYLEIGMLAYLFAGFFGTLGHLTFTYVHLSLIAIATSLIAEVDAPPRQRGIRVARPVSVRAPAA